MSSATRRPLGGAGWQARVHRQSGGRRPISRRTQRHSAVQASRGKEARAPAKACPWQRCSASQTQRNRKRSAPGRPAQLFSDGWLPQRGEQVAATHQLHGQEQQLALQAGAQRAMRSVLCATCLQPRRPAVEGTQARAAHACMPPQARRSTCRTQGSFHAQAGPRLAAVPCMPRPAAARPWGGRRSAGAPPPATPAPSPFPAAGGPPAMPVEVARRHVKEQAAEQWDVPGCQSTRGMQLPLRPLARTHWRREPPAVTAKLDCSRLRLMPNSP